MLKCLIIVDSYDATQQALEEIVTRMGYQAHRLPWNTCTPASFAIEPPPHLILLDYSHSFNGIALCQQLKSYPATQGIPIIIASTSDTLETQALEAGASAFIEKPFQLKHFKETISYWVDAKK